jgi:catechol 2,3-dioxygenase-like lactoylglutathione lyase family enzyme
MKAKGIVWMGTRTDRFEPTVDFFGRRLGLRQVKDEAGMAVFEAPNGDTVEVFGPGDDDHDHFSTGPVVGFLVDDVEAGRRELEEAGVELLGPVERDGGFAWCHFRGPDGNVYELTRSPEP